MNNTFCKSFMWIELLLITAHSAMADDKVFNIPVKEINPNWCSATVFSGTLGNKRSYIIQVKRSIHSVTVSVGSYTTCDDKKGTFLLALNTPAEADDDEISSNEKPKNKIMKARKLPFDKVIALQEFDKPFSPSLMKFQGGNFLLFDCNDCNDATLYKISSYPYKFVGKEKLDAKQVADGIVNPYFIDCKDALKLSEFSALNNYFDFEQSGRQIPDSCFRMNKYEYIFSDPNFSWAIAYWNAKTNEEEIVVRSKYIIIEREVTGNANKRFVLIMTDYASHGESGAEYYIFRLVPKTNNNHSYEFKSLINAHENPISGLCGDWGEIDSLNIYQSHLSTIEKATSINSYKILNDGTADLRIVFDITEQNCKSLVKTHFFRTFNIGDESFKEVIDVVDRK